jgi:hypothetical protein
MFFHRRQTERHFQEACSRPAAETHLCQGFASAFVTAQDGLTLHVRRYGSLHASAHSVVCLPGLARTAADFHPLATALAADPANPRLVLALDYRSHGQSQFDRNPKNYAIRVALADLSAVLATFGHICRHVFWWRTCEDAGRAAAGRSRGCYPERHRSRNGATGLMRITSYVGKLPIARNFEEGAEILRWLFEAPARV